LCAGGAVQDIVMRVDKFPDADTKVQASEFLITSGGQAGNAAVAVARLGGRVSFVGPLGAKDDEFASRIVESLLREKIDCSNAVRVPGAISSVSLILIDAAGEKMIATRRDQGLSAIAPENAERTVAAVDAVLLDNRYPNFVIPICKAAQARGIPRVLDFDKAAALDDPLLMACSHVISSAEALRSSTGLDDLSAGLKKLGQHFEGFLAFTDGDDGVYWLDDGEVRHMPAFKVKAIDTLGAGDVFHGAFIFRLVESADVVDAMRFAGAAAAIKCTRFGGLTGAATRAEVDDFLAQHPG
jgi:sugar/nucleoside kinase (ribokinase family)